MAIRIITDSTVDAAPAYKEQFAAIVPLTVSFGEEDYEDGVTLGRDDFYKKLESCRELPKTSQAAPEAFERAFREITDRGERHAPDAAGENAGGMGAAHVPDADHRGAKQLFHQ